ncbi:MAG: hypothetical protein JOY96_00540 [Verrucomicrobia bacterium]|nr:hypothetical protein [Verrucomicrobiota bacterium]MBV9673217.1 hypothetical protein [Verrucomicrobiota bacterium]
MSDHAIMLWTFIITMIGVMAGLAALGFAWRTIREAQNQARDNAKTAKAQFWIMLRGVFASYDDIHTNLRPSGNWYGSNTLPADSPDMGRTEIYMGLFEYCDRLLEERLIDKQAFADSYRYRLRNLLTNRWVIEQKLVARRKDWKAFINLCYRLDVPVPDVPRLTPTEHSELYFSKREPMVKP